jgi:hypothetical protein
VEGLACLKIVWVSVEISTDAECFRHPSCNRECRCSNAVARTRCPVQLAHASRLNGDQRGGNTLRGWEVVGADDADFTSPCFLRGSHRFHLEGVSDGRL